MWINYAVYKFQNSNFIRLYLKRLEIGGYFVSIVGIDEQTIRNYMEHQGEEGKGQAKLAL